MQFFGDMYGESQGSARRGVWQRIGDGLYASDSPLSIQGGWLTSQSPLMRMQVPSFLGIPSDMCRHLFFQQVNPGQCAL